MSIMLRQTRYRHARWKPRVEGLESRQLFAVSPSILTGASSVALSPALAPTDASSMPVGLAVVQIDPAPNAALRQSPQQLTVTFNQSFDPFTLTTASTDFALELVAADGTITPVDSSILAEPSDLFDPTKTLPLTLNQPLGEGHYRLTLLGGSAIAEPDGTPLAYNGTDQVLTDFTIQAPGARLSDAINLGTPGASPSATTGTLNFQANPLGVALYRVTLPAGHFWRLGAEVSAFRDGGTLATDLSLFDANGRLIATTQIGRADFPQDPYLFAGLQAGSYYLGVSGLGNVPGQPGGYDPASGSPGSVTQTQPGGPFQLHLAANPEDAPTRLQGLTLNRADPLDSTPTGLTLAFSGPLNLAGLASKPGNDFSGLEVVDQSGRSWPITPINYQEAGSQVAFLFNDRLPAGTYTLRVPTTGGLTDLAGLAPVASGEPAGVLATWKVAPSAPRTNPNDLGALLPGPAYSGPDHVTDVPAGEAVTVRFVATYPGTCVLHLTATGGPLAIQLIGPDGVISLTPGVAGQLSTIPVILKPGIHDLEFIAVGQEPAHLIWGLAAPATGADSFLNGGGPALNLTLIAPPIPDLSGDSPTATSGPIGVALGGSLAAGPAPLASGPSAVSDPGKSGGPASPSGPPTGSTGLVLTIGNSLVGRPNPEAEYVAAVGPGTQVGTTSLALNGPGLLQGINYGLTPRRGAWPTPTPLGEGQTEVVPSADTPAPGDDAIALANLNDAALADERALADSEWLTRLVDRMAHWFTRPGAGATDTGADPSDAPERFAMMRDDLAQEPGRVEQAYIGAPLGVVVVSALAMRLRQPVRRWLRRQRDPAASLKSNALRGPHTRF